MDAKTALDVFPAVHEQARRIQVGDVRTYPGRWRNLVGNDRRAGTQFVLCRDDDGTASGYAVYRIDREDRFSAHGTVIVDHFIARTGAAYRTLWAYLADLDLTDSVVAHGRPEHEPLRWALTDSSLVLEVTDTFCPWNDGRWLLEGGPDGARCRRAVGTDRAALRLDAAVLGSLFLGGPSLAQMARAGRVAADAATLRRADQMFGSDQDPWCSTEF